ncbi:MAG: phospholipase A [Spongiibacteraceae bacterium]|nr:phospholipase A [Spongiibacteraceae bacterium]
MRPVATIVCSLFIFFSQTLFASDHLASNNMKLCLLEQLQKSPGNKTVNEIRTLCQAQNSLQKQQVVPNDATSVEDAITTRFSSEEVSEADSFTLTAYKPNYLLFATYNDKKNEAPFTAVYPDANMDDVEAKFQVSFKVRMMEGVLGADLWGAYTQQSWWQVYNADESAPFRETNYEPEIFLRWDTDFELLGFKTRMLKFGFNHESNGRGEALSRSWNRLIAGALLEKGNLAIHARTWYRLPEDNEDDDNPDIIEYVGHGDLKVFYKMDRQLIGMTLTNNLRSDNKGSIQIDWTFPLTKKFKGYVQYYNGFGESLIDHDETSNRIGVGILLNDWL